MEVIEKYRSYWIYRRENGAYRIDGLPGDHPTLQHAREAIIELEKEVIF